MVPGCFVRFAAVVAIVCLAAAAALGQDAPEARPGQAVNGLKLELSAETDQVPLARVDKPAAGASAYRCEPVRLRLKAVNVSDKPIKLDGYMLLDHLKLSIVSTARGGVILQSQLVIREPRPLARSQDYPTIQPGGTRDIWEGRIPGEIVDGGRITVAEVAAPGTLRVAAVYARPADPPGAQLQDFQRGCWSGKAASNVLTFDALPPADEPLMGESADGLALGLSLPKYDYAVGERVWPTIVLRNVSAKPVLAMPLLVVGQTVRYKVVGPDGKEVRGQRMPFDWDVPDYDKAVKELAAGQGVDRRIGLGGYDLSKPGRYTVSATYRWSNAAPPPGRKPEVWNRGPIWTGEIRSGELAFIVGEPDRPRADGRQGVAGRVVKLAGNFMPGPGPRPGATRTPLAVPVYVFRGKVQTFAKPDPKHAALVATVRADKDGRFRVPLAPGEYTVVAEVDGQLYLNLFAGDGCWGTVTVKAGQWATFNIEETSGAAF